jgi:hypothetical protein
MIRVSCQSSVQRAELRLTSPVLNLIGDKLQTNPLKEITRMSDLREQDMIVELRAEAALPPQQTTA